MTRLRFNSRIYGPNNSTYQLTSDVFTGDVLRPEYFRAEGNAPLPVNGEKIPDWLVVALKDIGRNGSLSQYFQKYNDLTKAEYNAEAASPTDDDSVMIAPRFEI